MKGRRIELHFENKNWLKLIKDYIATLTKNWKKKNHIVAIVNWN